MANSRTNTAVRRTRTQQPARPMVALIPLAVWLAVTPFVGPALGFDLNVTMQLEIIDHVVPGLVAAGAATTAMVLRTRPYANLVFLLAASAAMLAGLFSTSTHVPLLGQAAQGVVPWGTAWFHTLPGIVVLVVALLALVPALRATD